MKLNFHIGEEKEPFYTLVRHTEMIQMDIPHIRKDNYLFVSFFYIFELAKHRIILKVPWLLCVSLLIIILSQSTVSLHYSVYKLSVFGSIWKADGRAAKTLLVM